MTQIIAFLLSLKELGDLEVRSLSVQCAPLASGVTIAVLGVAGAVVLALAYAHMRDTASARTRYGLLAVRLLLFALVLGCVIHPMFAIEARRLVKGRVSVLIDSSLSMTIQDVGGNDRFRAAEDAARRLIAALGASHQARPYVFSEDVAPQVLSAAAAPLPAPTGRRTDMAAALRRLRHETAGEHVVGIVLLSDGGNNYGGDPLAEAQRQGIPLYVVGVGGQPLGPDLRVSEVAADPFPFRGDSCPVSVTLKAQGLAGEAEGEVLLKHQGRPVASQRFRLSEQSGSETVVRLDYSPDRKGPMEMTVQASWALPDCVPQNNLESLRLNVSTRRIRVLMLDGQPRWEYAFVRRAMVSDPHVSVTAETKVAPELVYKQSDAYTRIEGGIFPGSLRELSQFDVLVLGDVKRTAFSIPQLFDVETFVAEAGGGLILLGGSHTLGPGQQYAKSPIANVLPFVYLPDGRRHEAEVTLRLTSEGARHPVMLLDNEPSRNAALWEGLNPMWGCWAVGDIRRSALVLAVGRPAGGDGPAVPAVVVQRHGRGRVLVFAGDTSWRWGLSSERQGQDQTLPEKEPNHHYRFWANALRWVSGDITDTDERTFVATDKNVYSEGETVSIQARVLDDNYRPAGTGSVTATVSRGGEETASLSLKPETGTRGFYRGAFRAEQTGTYTVKVKSTVPREGREDLAGEAMTTLTVESACREFADVALNVGLLRALAEGSGGKYYALDDVETAAADISRTQPTVQDTLEVDPLNAPATWLLFVALLFFEWIFRKTRGLA